MIANNRAELCALLDTDPELAAVALDEMARSPYPLARADAAALGTDEHREMLINDPHDAVRSSVAHRGTDEQRARLINDPSPAVLCVIAWYGSADNVYALRMTDIYNGLVAKAIDDRMASPNWPEPLAGPDPRG